MSYCSFEWKELPSGTHVRGNGIQQITPARLLPSRRRQGNYELYSSMHEGPGGEPRTKWFKTVEEAKQYADSM